MHMVIDYHSRGRILGFVVDGYSRVISVTSVGLQQDLTIVNSSREMLILPWPEIIGGRPVLGGAGGSTERTGLGAAFLWSRGSRE